MIVLLGIFLLLFQITLGTLDQDEAQTEWVIRPYMNTTKKRKFLGDWCHLRENITLCFAAILAPDMHKLVACCQSYTVRYIYRTVKHHKFVDGTFLVSFEGFEEVAIIFFFIFVIVIKNQIFNYCASWKGRNDSVWDPPLRAIIHSSRWNQSNGSHLIHT